jgi:hypothetical protein
LQYLRATTDSVAKKPLFRVKKPTFCELLFTFSRKCRSSMPLLKFHQSSSTPQKSLMQYRSYFAQHSTINVLQNCIFVKKIYIFDTISNFAKNDNILHYPTQKFSAIILISISLRLRKTIYAFDIPSTLNVFLIDSITG